MKPCSLRSLQVMAVLHISYLIEYLTWNSQTNMNIYEPVISVVSSKWYLSQVPIFSLQLTNETRWSPMIYQIYQIYQGLVIARSCPWPAWRVAWPSPNSSFWKCILSRYHLQSYPKKHHPQTRNTFVSKLFQAFPSLSKPFQASQWLSQAAQSLPPVSQVSMPWPPSASTRTTASATTKTIPEPREEPREEPRPPRRGREPGSPGKNDDRVYHQQ